MLSMQSLENSDDHFALFPAHKAHGHLSMQEQSHHSICL